jgi:hypothetical protein
MDPLTYLLEHAGVIDGHPILVRQVVGNGFGLERRLRPQDDAGDTIPADVEAAHV